MSSFSKCKNFLSLKTETNDERKKSCVRAATQAQMFIYACSPKALSLHKWLLSDRKVTFRFLSRPHKRRAGNIIFQICFQSLDFFFGELNENKLKRCSNRDHFLFTYAWISYKNFLLCSILSLLFFFLAPMGT